MGKPWQQPFLREQLRAARPWGRGRGAAVPAELGRQRRWGRRLCGLWGRKGKGFLGLLAVGSGEMAAYPEKKCTGEKPRWHEVCIATVAVEVGGMESAPGPCGPTRASCKWRSLSCCRGWL